MTDIIEHSFQTMGVTADERNLLIKSYTDSKLTYHNIMHIWHALNVAQQMIEYYAMTEDDQRRLFAGVWWHDAIYVPGATDNEERSARLYGTFASRAEELVHSAILETKSHTNPSSFISACLLDADLSGLGASPTVYEINRINVRNEYDVEDDLWYIGREKFLKSMLSGGAIFHTSFGAKWERQARKNMQAEFMAVECNIALGS